MVKIGRLDDSFLEVFQPQASPVKGQSLQTVMNTCKCIFDQKETYRQTRGLSNLEMKHFGELAIIGALLKAVKTSCVCTLPGRTYLI